MALLRAVVMPAMVSARGLHWAILLVALLATFRARALDPNKAITQYHQDIWTERDGLPQGSVQAILQTRDGYIWLGTRDGLARFDGVAFTVFRAEHQPGLESNDIRALYEDREGQLWIGTFNGGLSKFVDGRFSHYGPSDGLPGSGVLDIAEDRRGGLWLGTWNGFARLQGGKITGFTAADGLMGRNGWSLSNDRKGRLWIATANGLNLFQDGKFRAYTTRDGLPNNVVRKVYEDRDGKIWAGTIGGGLTLFEGGELRNFTTRDGLADNKVRSICEDRDGNLWIGTWRGLSRLAQGKMTSYAKPEGLLHEYVETLYEDREGSLWIGTHGGGLARLRDAKFSAYTTKEGLAENLTKCVFESRDGSVWIGSSGGGLSRFQDGHFTIYTTKDGLDSQFVSSIGEDKDGHVWVGTARPAGLCLFKDGKFVSISRRKEFPVEHAVRAILGDRDGNLWLGGDSGGLLRWRDGSFTNYSTQDGLLSTLIRVIAQDRQGDLWIGTGDGLCRLHQGRLTGYTTKDGLAHNAVYSIYEDADGVIWLGTQGGLSRFQGGRFTAYTTRDGLFQNLIFQILEDGQKNLWMSSNRGIFSLPRQAVHEFDHGLIQSLPCVPYGVADGMKTGQCEGGTSPAGWKTRNGHLWFPTGQGIVKIDPNEIPQNQQPPPVLIEQVMVDNKRIDRSHPATLKPGSGDLEFHYTALSFVAPEKVRFKYKLEGIDKDWVEAETRRVAFYNKIPPGQYNFHVMACNNDGIWNRAGASFSFYLAPHFYQTPWFYVLCAVSAALAAWSFHRHRMKRAQAQFSLVLAERNRIARDLHDTLAQGFAGIAFQLEAVAAKLTETPAQAQQHLCLALNMVRHSLSEARRTVMNLRSTSLEQNNLAGALSETARQTMAGKPIEFELETIGPPRSLPAKVEDNLLRIGQEAITNSLKHSSARKVRVELEYQPANVALRIRDNGNGFDVENTLLANGTHFGLLGMRERAKQMRAQLHVRSAPGSGTEVQLDVPVG